MNLRLLRKKILDEINRPFRQAKEELNQPEPEETAPDLSIKRKPKTKSRFAGIGFDPFNINRTTNG